MFVCVCVCVYVWAAVSAGLSLAVPAFLTLYVIVTVLDELNKRLITSNTKGSLSHSHRASSFGSSYTRRTRLRSFVVLCALFAVFIRFLTSLTYSFSHRLGALVEQYPILKLVS